MSERSNENTESVELEVMPATAIQSITAGECDVQVSTAHKFPRSIEKFKKRALQMATFDLETAESCIYKRPVGGGQIIQGESIRMAEIVAASYGNIRVAARIISQNEREVVCEGMAWDLESNTAGKCECKESTVTRSGEPYSERQRAVAAKACLAKAYRDAVFKVVPKSMCKFIRDAAMKVINKEQPTLEARRGRAMEWIVSLQIDASRVWAALGIGGESDIGEDQLETLTGFKTAISDRDMTVDEAFPVVSGTTAGTNAPRPKITTPAETTGTTTTSAPPAEEEADEEEEKPQSTSVDTVIASFEKKKAKNNNPYWVIKCTEGLKGSTFDKTLGAIIEQAVKDKSDVTVSYIKEGQFNTITDVVVKE